MRSANTYRAERRNDWRTLKGVTWAEHNRRERSDKFSVGTARPDDYFPGAVSRSKYMPHIGAKERGRYA